MPIFIFQVYSYLIRAFSLYLSIDCLHQDNSHHIVIIDTKRKIDSSIDSVDKIFNWRSSSLNSRSSLLILVLEGRSCLSEYHLKA